MVHVYTKSEDHKYDVLALRVPQRSTQISLNFMYKWSLYSYSILTVILRMVVNTKIV